MNACREFIMTCAEVSATVKGSYVPVKKTLPVLYERIGEERVNLMLASFIYINYEGRWQKSVLDWAIEQVSNNMGLEHWPEVSASLLYDFAKEVIKSKGRRKPHNNCA